VIPRGIQRFVGLRADGMEVSIPLQTVNNESRASTACDIALVPFTDRKLIAARVIQGGFAAIVQIMVHAVGNGARSSDAKWSDLAQPSQPLGIDAANTYFVNAFGAQLRDQARPAPNSSMAPAPTVGLAPGANPSNSHDLTNRSNPQDLTRPGGSNPQDLER
jgi:hypothetical protein